MNRATSILIAGMLFCQTAGHSQTNTPPPKLGLFTRQFRDYTILMAAAVDEPWRVSWNDPAQMALFENPTNGVVISTQLLNFPSDIAFEDAAGDRDAYLDVGLRRYCAALLAGHDALLARTQEIKTSSRSIGTHHFRHCPILGRDSHGPRRGFLYMLLRGVTRPKFEGEMLLFTISYPEDIDCPEESRVLKTFDVLLQNASFP